METPWRRARVQQQSQAQERRMAASAGGGKQVNSGRTWFSKRDSTKFNFLVENRLVDQSKQLILKGEELTKLTKDAFFHKKLPAMNIEFIRLRENWMLIRVVDFEEMHGRILELEALLLTLDSEKEEINE